MAYLQLLELLSFECFTYKSKLTCLTKMCMVNIHKHVISVNLFELSKAVLLMDYISCILFYNVLKVKFLCFSSWFPFLVCSSLAIGLFVFIHLKSYLVIGSCWIVLLVCIYSIMLMFVVYWLWLCFCDFSDCLYVCSS